MRQLTVLFMEILYFVIIKTYWYISRKMSVSRRDYPAALVMNEYNKP